MYDKWTVLLCVAALTTASNIQAPIYASSTPPPIQYVPVNPGGPVLITYSNPPASQGATIEAYGSVTTHPPPSAYKPSPTVIPHDPPNLIQIPQYISSPGAYPDAPIPVLANYPSQAYSGVPVQYVAVPKQYAGRKVIQLVDSSDAYTQGYVPQLPGSVSTPAPTPHSIPIPVEYPTAIGKKVGSHVVYAPVENSVGYNKPMYKPVATYAVQSAYANYAKSVAAYAPAPAVSRVSFNGLGVSYEY